VRRFDACTRDITRVRRRGALAPGLLANSRDYDPLTCELCPGGEFFDGMQSMRYALIDTGVTANDLFKRRQLFLDLSLKRHSRA
jgi:hypothetical protein